MPAYELPYRYLRLGWPIERCVVLLLVENSLCCSSIDSKPMCKITTEQIADTLGWPIKTVRGHINHIIADGWLMPITKTCGEAVESGFEIRYVYEEDE